jgi:hypothetical protein
MQALDHATGYLLAFGIAAALCKTVTVSLLGSSREPCPFYFPADGVGNTVGRWLVACTRTQGFSDAPPPHHVIQSSSDSNVNLGRTPDQSQTSRSSDRQIRSSHPHHLVPVLDNKLSFKL